MPFTHPLARDAKVCSTSGLKGEPTPILVIVTRLVLDQKSDKYKPKQIERLSAAAREWIEQSSSGVKDLLLINRPKKWIGEADQQVVHMRASLKREVTQARQEDVVVGLRRAA